MSAWIRPAKDFRDIVVHARVTWSLWLIMWAVMSLPKRDTEVASKLCDAGLQLSRRYMTRS